MKPSDIRNANLNELDGAASILTVTALADRAEALEDLKICREKNSRLTREREALRREVTELEIELAKYDHLLRAAVEIIKQHGHVYETWLNRAKDELPSANDTPFAL